MLRIEPIPAFQDNYIWLLERDGRAAVVDPGQAEPVQKVIDERGLVLEAIVVTHHHADHVGGVAELVAAHRPRVYGPAASPFTAIDVPLREGDRIEVLGEPFTVMEVPGHTLDHIAYWGPKAGGLSVGTERRAGIDRRRPSALAAPAAPSGRPPAGIAAGALFCGDTLFACGCGRLFEGTAGQMYTSLTRIATLPDTTRVYCAHEYTSSNIRFALAVEPENEALQQRRRVCDELREQGIPTVPSTMELERQTNPFLRSGQASVRDAARRHAPLARPDGESVFATLRAWKDGFRG
jgi:hydroxyacylglutathione hydrolase